MRNRGRTGNLDGHARRRGQFRPTCKSGTTALAVYLRYQHAIGYERLSRLFGDLYGRRWTVNKALGYERLRRRGRAFRRLTGVTPAAFEEIVGLIINYRFYTTHLFIGCLFGADDSTICCRFAVLEPLLAGAVGISKDRTLSEDNLKILLIDATEQPIERSRARAAATRACRNTTPRPSSLAAHGAATGLQPD